MAGVGRFADHFSGHAPDYARFRPDYPPRLFSYLAEVSPGRRAAWDCGTGNGQAALGLARHFERVFATDPSEKQLAQARTHRRVAYSVAAAEDSGLPDGSVELVTAAQAAHWFDRDRFWSESRRVAVKGGVVAIWCYDLLRIAPEIDAVIRHLYSDIVGSYWPPERVLTEERYRTIGFPFPELEPPPLRMSKRWTLPDLLGYLHTWSSVQRYMAACGEDPVEAVRLDLARVWGPAEQARRAVWDLALRVGRTA